MSGDQQCSTSDPVAQISAVEIYGIGIGPSSSHTVGPMRSALRFVNELGDKISDCTGVRIDLYGSLALTGKGHATDVAVMLGLSGYDPATIDPENIPSIIDDIQTRHELRLGGTQSVLFVQAAHLNFRKHEFLPRHPNAVEFSAFNGNDVVLQRVYYSIGGGTIMDGDGRVSRSLPNHPLDFPFGSAAELLEIARHQNMTIAGIMQANEGAWRPETETGVFLDLVRDTMMESIQRGCLADGILPGGLNVRRRAPAMHRSLCQSSDQQDPMRGMDWVSLYALAVNEENAAGSRIVTAPTNGAAGVLPAVLKYFEKFCSGASPSRSREFLLTAAAIGILYKIGASISAAEMGCQGEIGVACSMAAGALTAVLGGSNEQVANAAEIGMEHHLGLTCDPVGGLVQIPCIERNTMGAVKAINAARLALKAHDQVVSLDTVIETMRQTGADMSSKYKETSLGGLAVNVVAC
ncbi:L-serine ammonia-lyase [Bradyrhizobium xenonodulans]|uniref:L-serine dehydratase n=1 Tax=Bradyrhizobium xenonodulans TaxID=2736875 RepID=A0ABY7MIN4_9BRAD|nr:L-serine ammonia-lyase [Bradyrhizobium xenonodulans]WBL76765.1 L-serine ammonia-lyase [Bradyrhizobium xenonodulans]